jgi:hypothetical protein
MTESGSRQQIQHLVEWRKRPGFLSRKRICPRRDLYWTRKAMRQL